MRFLLFISALIFAPIALAQTALQPAVPAPERQKELVHLVRQDCGSCHGMTLQGGLGPALTPKALREMPPEALVATVFGGRPGTPMPPWNRFLTESEAIWVVDQLMKGFPE